jgi:hypothetical protein
MTVHHKNCRSQGVVQMRSKEGLDIAVSGKNAKLTAKGKTKALQMMQCCTVIW